MEIASSIREFFRKIESSKNTYGYPFPENTVVKRIETGGPSHTGPYKGAVDFIVDLGTPVLAPLEGVVVNVVDSNDRYGPSQDYENDLNYITLAHANGEFSQPAHLVKGSALVKEGDRVIAGQQIGVTGNSGWMTEPHLHFFVFRTVPEPPGFAGLNIRFRK